LAVAFELIGCSDRALPFPLGDLAGACVAPPAGLVGWWRGDDDARDSVGGNDGALMHGASFAAGEVADAFYFDGSTQSVRVADASSLEPSNALTIEAWVRADVLVYNARIADKVTPGTNDGYWLDLLRNHLRFGSSAIVTATPELMPGAWTHVAGVDDGATLSIYSNGMLAGTERATGKVPTNHLPLTIGASWSLRYGTGYYWNGAIDELSLYDRALSPSEIQALYSAGAAGKCK
jgi:hypothetical protein